MRANLNNRCLVRSPLRSPARKPLAAAVPVSPVCSAYLDLSNIWLNGAAVSAYRRGRASSPKIAAEREIFDRQFRLRFAPLRQITVGQDLDGTARTVCVGSMKAGATSTVCEAAERDGWNAIITPRARSGREKQVETTLSVLLLEDVLLSPARSGDLDVTLLSGDSDLVPAVRALQRRGRAVDVISWRHSMSTELRQLARRFIALDDFFDQIGYLDSRA